MLKADVTKEYTKIEIVGTLPEICTDLQHILSAINEKLSDKDAKLGHEFKVMFTKGLMDGVIFDEDREHMEHYLAEGDKAYKENTENKGVADLLDGLIDFLKDKRDYLDKIRKELDDEAE